MTQERSLLVLAGTRPEFLKLAPVIHEIRQTPGLVARTCFSGQHLEILNSVVGDFDIHPDVDFRAPQQPPRSLSQNLACLIERIDSAVAQVRPDGVIVQGDTNTVLAGALVAFHHQIPSFHVEAGLRTSDPNKPFPEEMNRRLVSKMSAIHFAPTERARQNLLDEGVAPESIEVTGNTGVDALRIYASKQSPDADAILAKLRPDTRRVLVTLHRRENASALEGVIAAVRRLVMTRPNVEVMWILHMNGLRAQIVDAFASHPSVHLIEPQSYPSFVHLMKAAHIILTDSGGVQEEAPILGKAILVLRDETERQEAVEAGSAKLVGCDRDRVLHWCQRLFDEPALFAHMSEPRSPFGDGFASRRIVEAFQRFYMLPRRSRRDSVVAKRDLLQRRPHRESAFSL